MKITNDHIISNLKKSGFSFSKKPSHEDILSSFDIVYSFQDKVAPKVKSERLDRIASYFDHTRLELVNENQRMGFLPKYFPRDFLLVENAIYNWCDNNLSDYNGGYWHYYRAMLLNKDLPLMILDTDEPIAYESPMNGARGKTTPLVIGLAAMTIILNHLGYHYYEKSNDIAARKYFDMYEKMREFSLNHLDNISDDQINNYLSIID